jgi:UDP-N-acetylmuramoyl-tripeptide--D-alanyl-D-alanine ligase
MMTLKQVKNWLGDGQQFGDGNLSISRVNTDTRSLSSGDLFIAIKGEHFDGNDFLEPAKTLGATAAIVNRGLERAGLAGVEVADTKYALGRIAAGWREQFTLPLVAVTGSNGKTTVTQMLASVFNAYKGQASLATAGNLNNDIGVPLTLLRLTGKHEIGVVELGMNHPGEIAYLANIAKPTIALVNNAQREHLEFMSTVEAVAHENGAVLAALPLDGIAIFPADDEYAAVWEKLSAHRPTMTFSMQGNAAVRCTSAEWRKGQWHVMTETPVGPVEYSLSIAGRHNVKNSLAALACALAAGVPPISIIQGLQEFRPVAGRSNAHTVCLSNREIMLIDDTYNANPDSVRAAIDVLAELDGPRLLVLGDMGEVGEHGEQFHAEVGEYAMTKNIEKLFTIGLLAKESSKHFPASRHFENMDALLAAVVAELPQISSLLVKGSRFMKMEQVVRVIMKEAKSSMEKIHAA